MIDRPSVTVRTSNGPVATVVPTINQKHALGCADQKGQACLSGRNQIFTSSSGTTRTSLYRESLPLAGALCTTANDPAEMSLWVISDHSHPRPRCRLCPRKRPQKRTSAGAFFHAASGVSNRAPRSVSKIWEQFRRLSETSGRIASRFSKSGAQSLGGTRKDARKCGLFCLVSASVDGDRTGWLTTQCSANRSPPQIPC